MPKVSVIIPVYNVELYLRKCLDSVINQTLKDIEIICVNDGSTDNSLKILEEYADNDSRIKIVSQQNGGLSNARNNAIKNATGEYIGFLDSDDWVSLDFYENLYNAAKKYKADIACTNLLRVSEEKQIYYMKCKKYDVSDKPRKKYKLAQIPQNNYVMNRIYNRIKLLKTKLQFEEGVLFEDMEFSHKVVYYLERLVTVPDAIYYYRDTPNSIVNVKSDKALCDYKVNFAKALRFRQENNLCSYNLEKYPYSEKISIKVLFIPIFTIKRYEYYYRFYLANSLFLFEFKRNKFIKDYE